MANHKKWLGIVLLLGSCICFLLPKRTTWDCAGYTLCPHYFKTTQAAKAFVQSADFNESKQYRYYWSWTLVFSDNQGNRSSDSVGSQPILWAFLRMPYYYWFKTKPDRWVRLVLAQHIQAQMPQRTVQIQGNAILVDHQMIAVCIAQEERNGAFCDYTIELALNTPKNALAGTPFDTSLALETQQVYNSEAFLKAFWVAFLKNREPRLFDCKAPLPEW